MAGNKFQDFIKRHSGGTTTSSSFSPYQRPSAQDLYNGYAREAEEEENKFQKFIKNHGSGAQQIPQGVMGYRQMQENTFRMQAEQAKAQREYRAELLPELEKKKTGEIAPASVQEAQARIAELETEVQDMLSAYGGNYYDGSDMKMSDSDLVNNAAQSRARGYYKQADALNTYQKATSEKVNPRARGLSGNGSTIKNSDAQQAASDIMDATGWDIETLNKYLSDAKTIGQFNYDKEAGEGFLTTEEALTYSQAKIESLSDEERAILNNQRKDLESYARKSYEVMVWGDVMSDYVVPTEDWREELKALNPDKWTDELLDEYASYNDRLANAATAEKFNSESFAIDKSDNTATKILKGAANTYQQLRPTQVYMQGILGSFENGEKADGLGRDVYSPNMAMLNANEYANQQVVNNAITDKHPFWQTAYGIGVSTGQAAEIAAGGALLGNAFGGVAEEWVRARIQLQM